MMQRAFLVAVGGGLGALARYLLGGLVQRMFAPAFPFATFTVNVTGCFLIGVSAGLLERGALSQEMRLFLMVGLLGGYTTFSTYGYESLNLLREGSFAAAAANAAGQLFVGLTAVWLGMAILRGWS